MSFWTFSPASAITRSSKRQGGFLNGTTNDCFVPETKCGNSSGICLEAIHNTGELSSRLKYTLAELSAMNFHGIRWRRGEDLMDSFLRKRTEEGFQNRYGGKQNEELFERARKQVQRELALIEKLEARGILPDCLGHHSILPRTENPRAGARFCRE